MIAVGLALLFVPLWPTTVALILVLLAYQQVENYLIGPRILGHSVELSPAAVLLATLLGAPPDRPRQQHPPTVGGSGRRHDRSSAPGH